MAEYGLPLHAQTVDSRYMMDDRYHDNGLTSPHDLGPWMEDQSDGGKFRLKRRRRCGQCGPCQVKENCGKCQYCVRKDVLKQACIYRKCVYLRKPVPRFRPEAAGSSVGGSVGGVPGSGLAVGGGGGGGDVTGNSSGSAGSSSTSLNKTSPQKPPSTPSTLTNHHTTHPTPPFNSAVAAAAAAVQSAEMSSSCQLAQSTFRLPMNNGIIDPLRTSALEQHRNALFDATGVLDPARTAYLSGARALDPGRSPALDLGRNTGTADSGLGTSGSSLPTSPASQTKDRPMPREQYRSPMEQWGANLPYFPRNPWGYPALQPNPAAYGFQSGATAFANPFASSCRLGMPDPTSHFAAPPQPTFPHNMPFPRPDFTASANFGGSGPPMQPTMTPPFYPPPPHIPSSLPNFPSFNQLPSSASGHGAYPVPHPPMYPGNFYPSFRPHSEPQIYHAHLPAPELPFLGPHGLGSRLEQLWDKHLGHRKGSEGGKGDKSKDSEDGDDLLKKFSIFRIPKCTHFSASTSDGLTEPFDLTKFGREDGETLLTHRHSVDSLLDKDVDKAPVNPDHRRLPAPAKKLGIDRDLRQQLESVMGRKKSPAQSHQCMSRCFSSIAICDCGAEHTKCDIISIDDFKMHAFIRSDNFNNLEIEIDDPCSPSNMALNSPHHQDPLPPHSPGVPWENHDSGVPNGEDCVQKHDKRESVRKQQNRNRFAKKRQHSTYSAQRQQDGSDFCEKEVGKTDLEEKPLKRIGFAKKRLYSGHFAQRQPSGSESVDKELHRLGWTGTPWGQTDLHEQKHKRTYLDEAQECGDTNSSTYSRDKADWCLGGQNDRGSDTQPDVFQGVWDNSEDQICVHNEISTGLEKGTTTSAAEGGNGSFADSKNWTGCATSSCRHDISNQRRDSFGGDDVGLVLRVSPSPEVQLNLSAYERAQARSVEHQHSLSDSVQLRQSGKELSDKSENLLPPLKMVVIQDSGEGGDDMVEVEVTGSRVHVETVVVDEDILSMSLDPDSLLRFISCHDHTPLPSSPNLDSFSDSDQTDIPPS